MTLTEEQQKRAEENLKTAYRASIIAHNKPEALFIPLDVLQNARKNYVITHLIDEINDLARMNYEDFKATAHQAKHHQEALKVLMLAKIDIQPPAKETPAK